MLFELRFSCGTPSHSPLSLHPSLSFPPFLHRWGSLPALPLPFDISDHGFHLGEFGMGFDKRQLYETDIRIPYFVRGPGVNKGSVSQAPVSHVDLAPTIIDLATGSVPPGWDGLSYRALLQSPSASWRTQQYIGGCYICVCHVEVA